MNAYTRAKHPDRSALLQRNTPKQTKDRPIFVTTCSTEARQINQIFPKPPLVSFRRCATLQNTFVHNYLKPDGQQTWLGSRPKGSYKCHQCNYCANVTKTKMFFMMLYPKNNLLLAIL